MSVWRRHHTCTSSLTCWMMWTSWDPHLTQIHHFCQKTAWSTWPITAKWVYHTQVVNIFSALRFSYLLSNINLLCCCFQRFLNKPVFGITFGYILLAVFYLERLSITLTLTAQICFMCVCHLHMSIIDCQSMCSISRVWKTISYKIMTSKKKT